MKVCVWGDIMFIVREVMKGSNGRGEGGVRREW